MYLNVCDERIARKIQNSIGKDKIEIEKNTIKIIAKSFEEEKAILNNILDICRDYECECKIEF